MGNRLCLSVFFSLGGGVMSIGKENVGVDCGVIGFFLKGV